MAIPFREAYRKIKKQFFKEIGCRENPKQEEASHSGSF